MVWRNCRSFDVKRPGMVGAGVDHELPGVSLVIIAVEMVAEAGLGVGARRGRRRLDETGEVVKVAAAGLERAAQGTHGGEHLAVDIGRQQADEFGQRGRTAGRASSRTPDGGRPEVAGATTSC